MTLEKLNQHASLRRQLAEAKELRASLEAAAGPGAQVITGMPHTPGYRDKLGDLAAEIADVSRDIKRLEIEIGRHEGEIAAFVQTIRDPHIRTVFRLRFLRGLEWGEVADVIGGGNTASAVSNACYRYIGKTCRAMRSRGNNV